MVTKAKTPVATELFDVGRRCPCVHGSRGQVEGDRRAEFPADHLLLGRPGSRRRSIRSSSSQRCCPRICCVTATRVTPGPPCTATHNERDATVQSNTFSRWNTSVGMLNRLNRARRLNPARARSPRCLEPGDDSIRTMVPIHSCPSASSGCSDQCCPAYRKRHPHTTSRSA
jgi:hypothetical protein